MNDPTYPHLPLGQPGMSLETALVAWMAWGLMQNSPIDYSVKEATRCAQTFIDDVKSFRKDK